MSVARCPCYWSESPGWELSWSRKVKGSTFCVGTRSFHALMCRLQVTCCLGKRHATGTCFETSMSQPSHRLQKDYDLTNALYHTPALSQWTSSFQLQGSRRQASCEEAREQRPTIWRRLHTWRCRHALQKGDYDLARYMLQNFGFHLVCQHETIPPGSLLVSTHQSLYI